MLHHVVSIPAAFELKNRQTHDLKTGPFCFSKDQPIFPIFLKPLLLIEISRALRQPIVEVAVAAFQVSLAYRDHRDLKDKMAQQVLKVPQVAKDLRVLLVPRAIKEPEASKVLKDPQVVCAGSSVFSITSMMERTLD